MCFGVLVQVAVENGELERLQRLFKDYYPMTLQESGLEHGKVMLDKDDPSRVFIYEIWKTQKDFENHIASKHAQKFMQDIQGTYGADGFVKYLTPFI